MTHVIATLLEDSLSKLTVPWPTAASPRFRWHRFERVRGIG